MLGVRRVVWQPASLRASSSRLLPQAKKRQDEHDDDDETDKVDNSVHGCPPPPARCRLISEPGDEGSNRRSESGTLIRCCLLQCNNNPDVLRREFVLTVRRPRCLGSAAL